MKNNGILDIPIMGTPYSVTPQYSPQPLYNYQANNNNDDAIFRKYEIQPSMAEKLYLLRDCKIIIIADDSTSMREPTEYGTRWKELQTFVNICVEIVNTTNASGIDVYFLNNPQIFQNIHDPSQLQHVFQNNPSGNTQLTRTFQRVMGSINNYPGKVLVIIITDGEPTNDIGQITYQTINEFKHAIMRKAKNVFVNVLACTTNEQTMAYLGNWDEEIDNFDVTDDYESEKALVIKANNNRIEFTYGTYVLKTIIGSIDPDLDNLNEKQNGKHGKTNSSSCSGCCIS
jgi:hypothetical protein